MVRRSCARYWDICRCRLERQIEGSSGDFGTLPEWVPFAGQLEPYRADIATKLASLVSKAGGFVLGSLSKMTQMTAIFLLNLFVMLYAMFFFLISSPAIASPLTNLDAPSKEPKNVVSSCSIRRRSLASM